MHLNAENFDAAVKGKVALVDFWAEWCGPCRMLGPVIDEVAAQFDENVVVAKINIDEAQALAVKFGVRSIPAIFILNDGKVVNQFVGVQDKQTLTNAIKSA
jgi:thioredoxin 1